MPTPSPARTGTPSDPDPRRPWRGERARGVTGGREIALAAELELGDTSVNAELLDALARFLGDSPGAAALHGVDWWRATVADRRLHLVAGWSGAPEHFAAALEDWAAAHVPVAAVMTGHADAPPGRRVVFRRPGTHVPGPQRSIPVLSPPSCSGAIARTEVRLGAVPGRPLAYTDAAGAATYLDVETFMRRHPPGALGATSGDGWALAWALLDGIHAAPAVPSPGTYVVIDPPELEAQLLAFGHRHGFGPLDPSGS